MKVLVAGWFSFAQMGATAGDLLARAVVCDWLAELGQPFDIALGPEFAGGVDWRVADPSAYSHVVFVCGPFGNGWPIPEFLTRFSRHRLIGVNLSMLQPLGNWNPFDVLLERDSSLSARPDLAFLAKASDVPVVGVILVHDQKEYRHGVHPLANAAIERLIASRSMALVRIDTRLDVNATGLRTAAEIESLIARMDVVVTTRLHGLVLAIKNGVPAIAIDPIGGGAKLCRQAEAIGWPLCFSADTLDDQRLNTAFDHCLTVAARTTARQCAHEAQTQLSAVRQQFIAAVASPTRVT